MFDKHTEYLIEKHADQALTLEEQSELDILAARDPTIDQHLKNDESLRSMIRKGSAARFGAPLSEGVMRTIAQEAAVTDLLSQTRAVTLNPFFDARVMRRVSDEATRENRFFTQEVVELLGRLFPRIAMPAVAAASLAMAVNVGSAANGTSATDALFGLPSEEPSEIAFLILDR